jgi:hypothetical protein
MRCAWFNGKWRAMCQHDINTSTIYNQVLPFKGPSCFSPLYSEHLYIYYTPYKHTITVTMMIKRNYVISNGPQY